MKPRNVRLLFGSLLLVGSMFVLREASAQPVPSDTPDYTEQLKKAGELFGKGDLDGCLKELQVQAEKTKTLPPARLMLARMLLATNNQQAVQAGRNNLEVVLTEQPNHPECYLTNGTIALNEGRLTEAVLNFQAALGLAEQDTWTAAQKKTFMRESRAGLATAFENRRDWPSARTALNGWLVLDEKNGQVRQRLARALFFMKRPEDALAELATAVQNDSKLEPPEVTMGLLFASQEDREKAKEWFEKAIAKYPAKAKVHQAYGGWLLDTGKLEEAGKHIKEAEKLDPKSRETLGLLGLQSRYEGNLTEAEKNFEDCRRLAVSDFFAINQLALVFIESQDKDKQALGIQYAELNAQRFPRNAEALASLGWAYFKSKKYDEAENILARATSGGQASPDTAFYLASVLNHRSKYDEAFKILFSAGKSKGVFVNRKAAAVLYKELKTKVPADAEEKLIKEEKEKEAPKKSDEPMKDKDEPKKSKQP